MKKMPMLRTDKDIMWEEEGTEENFRVFCELLKRNAIPTKTLDLSCCFKYGQKVISLVTNEIEQGMMVHVGKDAILETLAQEC